MFRSTSTWPGRGIATLQAWLEPLLEWPFWALLALLTLGIALVAQQPLHYLIDIGYEEGWWSDRPLISGWNTGEPEHAKADDLSYRWSAEDSQIWLRGVGGESLVATLQQLPASANPQAETGAPYIGANGVAVSQPMTAARTTHLLLPPQAAQDGRLRISAPTFTPNGDPRTLGAPVAKLQLASTSSQALRFPSLRLFWPLLMLPIVWITSRRWCMSRRYAAVLGLAFVGVLLAALFGDRLRFALAGRPLLIGALWGVIVAGTALVAMERYAPRLSVRPSPHFVRWVALLIFWLMLLRYGGRLYPESMIGDLGFHVNRQNDVLRGLVHLTSLHRGIAFPYPSATYILLAPLRLLPVNPYSLVEWSDAAFGALGLLPVAYLALRGLDDERTALLITTTYACLAPAMMALWWSFLAHIFAQEAVVLLLAIIVGGWHLLKTQRGVALMVVAFSLVFFGHFGLYINISLLIAGVLPILWWRYRTTVDIRSVYGLAAAFVIAQVLALGLFYSAYLGLILEKLGQSSSGGMSEVQGGRATISAGRLLLSLWRDGVVAHYAVIGVPLALLGGYLLLRHAPRSLVTSLFVGTLAVAALQAAIPFLTSSTISTRWLSFCAWIVAFGVGVALDWLWRRGKAGQSAAIVVLVWIGGNTLWLWVQAIGYRIRPPEPF